MLSVNSHSAALVASAATSVNREMEISMERLSTGKRINSAGDDAAGVAIASRLSSEIRGVNQGIRNAMDGQSLIDTAEGAHQEIETILQRMREVSVQAANDTNSTLDRTYLQDEIDQLSDEINVIAFSTKWAGKSLMSETNTAFTFQVGATNGVADQITADIGSMTNDTLFTVPDGFADLIVGSHRANGNKGTSSVVFGKADGTAVNLSDVAAGTGGRHWRRLCDHQYRRRGWRLLWLVCERCG